MFMHTNYNIYNNKNKPDWIFDVYMLFLDKIILSTVSSIIQIIQKFLVLNFSLWFTQPCYNSYNDGDFDSPGFYCKFYFNFV